MKMCRDNATPTRPNAGSLHLTGNAPIGWGNVSQFLPFKRVHAVEPDASTEELAEELGIDPEQAERWTEQKKHLKRLYRRIGDIRSWADVERKMKQLYIFLLFRNRSSY